MNFHFAVSASSLSSQCVSPILQKPFYPQNTHAHTGKDWSNTFPATTDSSESWFSSQSGFFSTITISLPFSTKASGCSVPSHLICFKCQLAMKANPSIPQSSSYRKIPLLVWKADYTYLWQLPAPSGGSKRSCTHPELPHAFFTTNKILLQGYVSGNRGTRFQLYNLTKKIHILALTGCKWNPMQTSELENVNANLQFLPTLNLLEVSLTLRPRVVSLVHACFIASVSSKETTAFKMSLWNAHLCAELSHVWRIIM